MTACLWHGTKVLAKWTKEWFIRCVCLYSSSVQVGRVNFIPSELLGSQLLLPKHKSSSFYHICLSNIWPGWNPQQTQKPNYLIEKKKTSKKKNLSALESVIWKELGELLGNGKGRGLRGGAGFCWRPAASHQPCMVLSVSPRLQSWCAEAQSRRTDGPFWKRATAQWSVCGVPLEPPGTNTISVCWERTGA